MGYAFALNMQWATLRVNSNPFDSSARILTLSMIGYLPSHGSVCASSLAFEVEHVVQDDAFWEWVHQGVGDDGAELLEPVCDGFVPADLACLACEPDGHLKRCQVQHALFMSLHMN